MAGMLEVAVERDGDVIIGDVGKRRVDVPGLPADFHRVAHAGYLRFSQNVEEPFFFKIYSGREPAIRVIRFDRANRDLYRKDGSNPEPRSKEHLLKKRG